MKEIKVLHIFKNLEVGGAQKLILDIYKNINKEKIQFDILVSEDGELDILANKLGIKIFKIPYLTKVGPSKYKKNLIEFFRNHPEYNIIHSHIDQVSGIVMEAAKKANVKIRISHSHNTNNSNGIAGRIYKRYLQIKILKYANAYIGCSKQACKWLFKSKDAYILNNGIDVEKFKFNSENRKKIRDKLNIPEDAVVIGNIGRLEKQKNQKFLILCFKEYLKQNKNSYLIIIGEGSLEEKLVKLTRKLNIQNNVKILKNKKNINEFYSAFDIFMITSKYEGFCITYTEAIANNCICIVPEKLKEILKPKDNNVFFLPIKNNEKEWSNSIAESLNKKSTKEVNNKIEKYDIKVIASELEDYYMDLIKNKIGDINNVPINKNSIR